MPGHIGRGALTLPAPCEQQRSDGFRVAQLGSSEPLFARS